VAIAREGHHFGVVNLLNGDGDGDAEACCRRLRLVVMFHPQPAAVELARSLRSLHV
jgi:hypothetical protein